MSNKKNIDTTGILFNKKSYVLSEFNILSFIIRYALVVISSFLIVYIGFSSFNIDIEINTMLKLDIIIAFILMLADVNIITALIVNGGLLYLLYEYVKNNFEIIKNGVLSIMNEAYSMIRIAFSLPDVDGFDKVMQNTMLTVNMVAGVVTVAVVMLIAIIIGRYMSKILYGIVVSFLLGLIAFGGGTAGIKPVSAILATFIIVCILNLGARSKISFGNNFKRSKKHIYSQKGDSLYIIQLCLIACVLGIIAHSVKGIESIPNNYSNNLKATVRDIAVMKYVEYKNFGNQKSFDLGQVGYQAYFKPDMKKIKTVQLKPTDNEITLLKEFTGENYVYRMNMWTSADTEDINSYLDIDENNKSIIDKICIEQNFSTSSDMAKAVSDYLINNYTYTLDTEPLPFGKDFVNSFLEETKKGNAAHFASAAVLIFRDMGIPARYVSGYKVDNEYILTGKYDRKSGKFNVDITNANAYSWVEIYDSEKGWTTVNVSEPPSMKEMKDIIDSGEEKENPSTDIDNYFRTVDKEKYTPKNIVQNLLKAIVKIMALIMILAFLIILIILAYRSLIRYIKYIRANNSEKAIILINSFSEKAGINTNSLKELGLYLKRKGNSSEAVDKMILLAEKIMFSPESNYSEVKKLNKILKGLNK